MVGRASALNRLIGLVEAAEIASSDGPEIALVSGEAGVGKTRLLRELVAEVPADVTVLTAHAQPGSLGRPFDVVAGLSAPGVDPAIGVLDHVGSLVEHGRVVLIIEDIHWADADSVHIIEQIARQPWPRLVLVATYRPGDLSRKAPGGELLLGLERQHTVEQLRLDRLDRAEVGAMLTAISTGPPSSAAVDAVFRRSGGNPFVVEELLRCCGPDACTDDLLSAQLPWSLDEAIRQQLSGLQSDPRRVVDVLAVYADPAPFDVLQAVTELADASLVAALQQLVDVGIVIESSDDTFWFAHALMADAVHQQLLGRERRRLHERSLAALRAMPNADHASLARHALGAGQYEQIPGIAREGVRRYLARGASFQALRLASDALAEAPDDPELLGVATDAAWRLQFGTEALGFARRWLEVANTDIDRVEARRFASRVLHELGELEQRDAALADLIEFAEALPDGLAKGRAIGAVAQIHMISGHGPIAIEWAERALAFANRNADEWLRAQALVERNSAWGGNLEFVDLEQNLLEARDAARSVGDAVLESRALNNLLSVIAPHSARAAWARHELTVAAKSCGLDRMGEAMRAMYESEAAYGSGDMRLMRQSVAEASQFWAASTKEHCSHLALLADLAVEEGRVNDADAAIESLLQSRRDRDEHEDITRVQLTAAMLRQDRPAVVAVLDRIASSQPPTVPTTALWMGIDTTVVALIAGVPAAVVRAKVLDQWFVRHYARENVLRHVAGLLSLAEGRHADAVVELELALATIDPQVYVPLRGSLRTGLAAARLAAGDRAGALEAAKEAVTIDLVGWPGWRRDRAEALLRRLEGHQRSDGELTAREREVSALIAEGLTNGQLAERLFISPKTAAVHVSNILMKLGLSGRAEIAAWAVRHDAVFLAN